MRGRRRPRFPCGNALRLTFLLIRTILPECVGLEGMGGMTALKLEYQQDSRRIRTSMLAEMSG